MRKLRIQDAVREFVHEHVDGVCKPNCYGCFLVAEATKDVEEVEEKLTVALLQIEIWKQYHALLGEELNDLAVLATMRGWKSKRAEEGKRFREKLGLEPVADKRNEGP